MCMYIIGDACILNGIPKMNNVHSFMKKYPNS